MNQQLTAMLCPKDGNQTAAGCTNDVDDASIPKEWQRIKRREPKSMRRKKREVRREERRREGMVMELLRRRSREAGGSRGRKEEEGFECGREVVNLSLALAAEEGAPALKAKNGRQELLPFSEFSCLLTVFKLLRDRVDGDS
ncbi:uncharacterized protein RAG0_01654 [Rhynchosporium agropyri]|uniref:Uncharacterized protein n=1 Tax=Rhynchosporium agropyri TaxID=914238 RepID=A0A1E1JYB4_9HELO|nr:uncharacterized protein RAG0_01654 [Rhynchosporium agropyri]